MEQHTWQSFPDSVRRQLDALSRGLQKCLGDNITGIYLHGSLAMGCFHPDHSDIDLLATLKDPLSTQSKRQVIELLLSVSNDPAAVEISLLTRGNLFPWRYPPPYELHYGESWRQQLESELASGAWRQWDSTNETDPDLAAHITVLHERGVALLGPAISRMFPQVPSEHYLDSILADCRWARQRIQEDPVYGVLNMARALLYLEENRLGSKAEAGRWAVEAFPEESRPVIRTALARYLEADGEQEFQPNALQRFVEGVDARIAGFTSVESQGPNSPGTGQPA